MNTVIKGTKSITEFKRKKSELTSMAEKHYADHVEISEAWDAWGAGKNMVRQIPVVDIYRISGWISILLPGSYF